MRGDEKIAFTVMNYLLPDRACCPCTARSASARPATWPSSSGSPGTGKTTLVGRSVAAPIGDDEHGWGPNGIFNFEGGCYAKTIRLSATMSRNLGREALRGDARERRPRSRDAQPRLTPRGSPRTRAGPTRSTFIGGCRQAQHQGPSADDHLPDGRCHGMLPPISRLTREQTKYHFVTGYTAKLAGTESGSQQDQRHVQRLLRLTVPAAPAGRLRAGCWPIGWRGTRARSGWSTRAGPAVHTGSVSA